ncbi:MAG: MTH1187 family thiamine-binding protein [Candidatus Eiseniibacteriota bacterium]|nr:MAG: MTH1187 family thiamine-binding protein [Candidatus Eisenbacteria bacterium]
MPVCEVSVVPVGTGSPSVSEYVVEAQRIIKQSGLKSHLSPMCTCVEGELPQILQLVSDMHEACFRKGAKRVLTSLKIDDRRDKPLTMGGKISSVEKKLG